MKKIHVVQMIHGLPYGGAERCVIDLVNNANPYIFDFTIIIFRNIRDMEKEISRPDVKVVLVEKRGKTELGFSRRVEKVLREIKPDVVHTHLFTADVWGRLAAKRLGIPVVTTEHNINVADGWLKNKILRYMNGYSQKYIACSDAVKKYAREVHGIEKNIEMVRCGVDLNKYANSDPLVLAEPFRLTMIGRLTKQKGQWVALEALSKLQEYNWELEIYGEGECEKRLKELANNLDIAGRVKFLGPTSDVPGVLKNTQIVLMPSLWEGLGIVVMEAMAAGRLVMASKVGGITELVKNNQTGLLVEPNDSEFLAKALKKIFENPEKYLPLASAARAYAHENFDIKKMILSHERIYEDLANKI